MPECTAVRYLYHSLLTREINKNTLFPQLFPHACAFCSVFPDQQNASLEKCQNEKKDVDSLIISLTM